MNVLENEKYSCNMLYIPTHFQKEEHFANNFCGDVIFDREELEFELELNPTRKRILYLTGRIDDELIQKINKNNNILICIVRDYSSNFSLYEKAERNIKIRIVGKGEIP